MAKVISGPSKGVEGKLINYNAQYYILRVKGKIKNYKPATVELEKEEFEEIVKDKNSDFHNFYKPAKGEFRFMKSFMNRVVS